MSENKLRKKLKGSITIRINSEDRIKLEKISSVMGLSPSTLARVWIIERLIPLKKLLKNQ